MEAAKLSGFTSSAIQILHKREMVFEMKSPTHLVIEGIKGYYDYWPTTGKWINRENNLSGFGLTKLMNHFSDELSMSL